MYQHIKFTILAIFMYNLAMLHAFTWLCNQSLELFHFAKLRFYNNEKTPHSSQPLATAMLLSVSVNLIILGWSYPVSQSSPALQLSHLFSVSTE